MTGEATLQLESREQGISALHPGGADIAAELWNMADKFVSWLQRAGYGSFDPYDVWSTKYGRMARRLYYEKNVLGSPLVALFVLMEIAAPGLRSLIVRKDRYPTADAQLILAFVNLYLASRRFQQDHELRSNEASSLLAKAEKLGDDLLAQSIPGYRGYCWGYPFDWQNVNGLMPKGTPHITATPYCYEAFTRLYEVTGKSRYLEVAESTIAFVSGDLKDTPDGANSAASSYTPFDQGKVVNASAYRAFLLFDAADRFQNSALLDQARKNLRFILNCQREDGSWLYAVDNPAEAFIDNFHTCFVLKNLSKINRLVQSEEVRQAIRHGYHWYRKNLFHEDGTPKCYARAPRVEIVHLEMYNVAEAITLGTLLKDEMAEAYSFAVSIATRFLKPNQLPAGHWVTRVYLGGVRHKMPFLRWPQSQLFLALTNLLLAVETAGR